MSMLLLIVTLCASEGECRDYHLGYSSSALPMACLMEATVGAVRYAEDLGMTVERIRCEKEEPYEKEKEE